MFEGRDDTLSTAVEISQEIMNKIVSEAGNSEGFFCLLLSYPSCLLGMYKELLSNTYVTVTPLYLHYEVDECLHRKKKAVYRKVTVPCSVVRFNIIFITELQYHVILQYLHYL